jgi:hypothetical protein
MAEENKIEKTKNTNNNKWRYTTIALMVIVVLLISAFLWKPGENSATGGVISLAESNNIANKTLDFLNNNIIKTAPFASLDSVKEESGILNITVLYQNRSIPIFATTDGKYLILPGGGLVDMTQTIPQTNASQQQQQQPTETPKTDKPTVQLFVMAFCPYGIQAEQAMNPVADLLGSKADIQVRFIASVGGTTPDTVQSLHGAVEAQEDLRQVCIMKYYDQKTYWKYMMAIDATCSGQRTNTTVYDACWKSAVKNASIDATKIDTCSKAAEGVNLLKADDELATSKGVSGSPTLIINGVTYNGDRTPDAYKTGICNAFTTAPSECSQQLSATGTAASGGCAT